MTYDVLGSSLQQVIIFNYEQLSKFILMFIIFTFSLVYRFYWKDNKEQETPFMSVAVVRLLLDKFSKWLLILSPFFFLYLHPAYSMYDFALMFAKLFGLGMSLFLFLLGLDIVRIGIFGVMEKLGVNMGDPLVKRYIRNLEKNIPLMRSKP